MLIKIIIVIAFLLILSSLGSALFYLIKGNQSAKTVKALSFRIGLSVLLFVFIVLADYFGAIQSHGLRPNIQNLEAGEQTK